MSDGARERGLAGAADVGTWTPEEAAAYETAHDLLNALVAACSARLSVAPPGKERQRLLIQQQELAQQRRSLTVFDQEVIRGILEEYPVRIRDVQGTDQ